MKFAFQMDFLTDIKMTTDSTWQMMLEGNKRGALYHYHPQNLLWKNNEVLALAQKVTIEDDESYNLGNFGLIHLEEFDAIFIRQDPPYDMAYLTTTYILEKIVDKTLIINNPAAIRNCPEKILCLDYPNLIPATLITYNFEEMINFANAYDKIVMKPLYGFAGKDVFTSNTKDPNFKRLAQNLINLHKCPIIIQEFIPQVFDGDKRIIIIEGEIAGFFNRIPATGNIRANMAQGGEAGFCELSSRDLEICKTIGPDLKKQGLFFVGIDIIGPYITEINVTSPTGIVQAKRFSNINITNFIWDKIENMI